MLNVQLVGPGLGQQVPIEQLPATIEAGKRGVRRLTEFQVEILRVARQFGTQAQDLQTRSVFIAEIRRPDIEPDVEFGQFPIELDADDAEALIAARFAVVAAIGAVRSESAASVRRRAIDRDAFPTFNPGVQLSSEATRIQNLIDMFDEEVLGRKPLKGPRALVIVGGIVLGLAAVSAIVYFSRERR
jgi:hypothetical protein